MPSEIHRCLIDVRCSHKLKVYVVIEFTRPHPLQIMNYQLDILSVSMESICSLLTHCSMFIINNNKHRVQGMVYGAFYCHSCLVSKNERKDHVSQLYGQSTHTHKNDIFNVLRMLDI